MARHSPGLCTQGRHLWGHDPSLTTGRKPAPQEQHIAFFITGTGCSRVVFKEVFGPASLNGHCLSTTCLQGKLPLLRKRLPVSPPAVQCLSSTSCQEMGKDKIVTASHKGMSESLNAPSEGSEHPDT